MDSSSSSRSSSLNPSSRFDEERAPLRSSHPTFGRANSSLDEPRTPTAKEDDSLFVPRLRRKGITESQEIWEELEDASLPPLSPFSYRRASARSTPHAGATDMGDEAPHEGTALLGPERSSTVRTYRSRRKRSAPVLSRDERARSGSAQAATGGWWKMKWWGGEREGKGKARRHENQDEEGN